MQKRLIAAATLTLAAFVPFMARSQKNAPLTEPFNFRIKILSQLPSYIEHQGEIVDTGMQFRLRCGYDTKHGIKMPDPSFAELKLWPDGKKYNLYQSIGTDAEKKVVVTLSSSADALRTLVEVITPGANASVVAQDCAYDPGRDALSDCRPAQPLPSITGAANMANFIVAKCDAFVRHPPIEPSVIVAHGGKGYEREQQSLHNTLKAKLDALMP